MPSSSAEIAVLPLALHLSLLALVFTVLNARCWYPHSRRSPRARAVSAQLVAAPMSASRKPRTGHAGLATWPGFLLMCLGMFMAILDIQVVATSLPTIQEAFAISADAMSWIQTAYLIAEVIAIPLTGLLTRVLPCAGCSSRPSRCSRWPRSAAPSAAASPS